MYSIGDIRRNINTTHLADLLPIEKLNKKNNHLYKEYVLSALTYEDIIDEFPFLKGEPLYASKSISNPCYYYDKEALFPISLYPVSDENSNNSNNGDNDNNEKNVKPCIMSINCTNSLEDIEKEYRNRISYVKERFKEGEGLKFIDCDTMEFEFFIENIDTFEKNEKNEKNNKKELFDIAMDLYTSNDYGFNVFGEDIFRKIVDSRTKHHLDILNDNLSEIKNNESDDNEELIIYRGEGEYSTNQGYSYSLDINTAIFFAARYKSSHHARLIKAKIKKKDIIWYSDERNEREVIVYPDKVYDKEIIPLYTCYDEELHQNMQNALDLYQGYRATLREFPYTHQGSDHNKEHMLRVLFLGLLMTLRECPEIHLEEKDAHTLAIALSLHDVGRDNDGDDTEHGINSYEIFKKNFKRITRLGKDYYNDEWVRFLMEYHCKDDNLAIKEIKNMDLDFKGRAKLMTFYNILKDADALDRVRFGFECLDVNYLRLKNSIRYVLFANQLIRTLEL